MSDQLARENARQTLRKWLAKKGKLYHGDPLKGEVEEATKDIARLAGYLGVDLRAVRAEVEVYE